jgi:hypothetical protein
MMGAPPDLEAQLERLAEKYRTLAELRTRREALERDGLSAFDAREAKARRTAFRKLAREFPGALRELDTTPAEVLRGRSDAVGETQRALRAGLRSDLPLWMELAGAYHAQLREVLAIKRWLSRREVRVLDAATLDAFRGWYARLAFRLRPTRTFDAEQLKRYLHPPQGRLQLLIWESMELRFERPRAEIERLIFGSVPNPSPTPGR